jgi:hypothetical protein
MRAALSIRQSAASSDGWLAAGGLLVRYAPGAAIAIDPADYLGRVIFRTGYYEHASLALALRIMAAQPGLFVDVSAKFGWYTCAVAAIAGPRYRHRGGLPQLHELRVTGWPRSEPQRSGHRGRNGFPQ